MAVCEFTYHRPQTLAETHDLLEELGPRATLIAGGTDLVPDLKQDRERSEHLISLARIDELSGIRAGNQGLWIGATTTLAEVAASPAVRAHLLALVEAAGAVGGVQIRNQATIGGNFCRAVPCADTPPSCIAAEATISMLGREGTRTVSAEEFFLGKRRTQLGPGEIMSGLEIPTPPPHTGTSYQRFTLRGGSALAVAAVAVRITLSGERMETVRVVMGAVAPVPKRARECEQMLAGQSYSDDLAAKAAAVAADEAEPISDLRGSADYRRRIVEVLTRRGLEHARRRARG